MDSSVSILKLSHAMARHAAHQNAVTAQNLSRTDIPEAKARQVEAFADALRRMDSGDAPRVTETGARPEVESEMLGLAESRGRQEAATAIWKSTLTMMRMAMAGPR